MKATGRNEEEQEKDDERRNREKETETKEKQAIMHKQPCVFLRQNTYQKACMCSLSSVCVCVP